MSEEAFKKFVEELEFKDDAIYYRGQRMIIASAEWLSSIQTEAEKVLGSNGALVVLTDAARVSGQETIRALAKAFASLPVNEMVQQYFKILYLRGWGKMSVLEYNEEPFFMKIKYEKSYLEGFVSGAEEPKCFYFDSIMLLVQEILKLRGINKELITEETQCVAMGAPYCVFEFKEL